MNTPTLETNRLILRQFTESDIDALFHIYSDVETNRFLPRFPMKTLEEAASYLYNSYLPDYAAPAGYRYAICLKEDNIPIGYVNLGVDESHDLGYGLLSKYWHQGIVREACEAIVCRAKLDGIPYITATHDVLNSRSGNVMRAIGMSYKYSYNELWQPKNYPVTFRMYQLNLDGCDERLYQVYWDRFPDHFIETII